MASRLESNGPLRDVCRQFNLLGGDNLIKPESEHLMRCDPRRLLHRDTAINHQNTLENSRQTDYSHIEYATSQTIPLPSQKCTVCWLDYICTIDHWFWMLGHKAMICVVPSNALKSHPLNFGICDRMRRENF